MENNSELIDDQVNFRDELYNLEATPDEIEYATENIIWLMKSLGRVASNGG